MGEHFGMEKNKVITYWNKNIEESDAGITK